MLEHFSCFFSLRSRRLSCRTAFRYASAYKKTHILQAIPRSSPVPKYHRQVIFVASNTFLYLNSFGCYPPIRSAPAATTTTTPPVIQSNFAAIWNLNTDEATFSQPEGFFGIGKQATASASATESIIGGIDLRTPVAAADYADGGKFRCMIAIPLSY